MLLWLWYESEAFPEMGCLLLLLSTIVAFAVVGVVGVVVVIGVVGGMEHYWLGTYNKEL